MSEKIRVISLGILQREDGKILLDKGYGSKKDQNFYRPLGGGVDFGEKACNALIREFKEEIDKDIKVTEFITSVENIFEFEGRKGHEIVFLYKCYFTNENDMALEEIRGVEKPDNISVWRSIDDINAEGAKLYPEELADLLA